MLNATEMGTNGGVCGFRAESIVGQGRKCGIESIKQQIAAREGWQDGE